MGITRVTITVANPVNLRQFKKKKLLVDTGALYSIVPRALLKSIGIRPYKKEIFTLADGSTIKREVGTAFLSLNGRQAPTPVIFGEKKDGALLGVIALESLGLTVNPRTGKLQPIPLLLM